MSEETTQTIYEVSHSVLKSTSLKLVAIEKFKGTNYLQHLKLYNCKLTKVAPFCDNSPNLEK